MAAGPSIDVTGWLQEQLTQASPDLLRSMVQTFAEALMGAEADAVCGAAVGRLGSGVGNSLIAEVIASLSDRLRGQPGAPTQVGRHTVLSASDPDCSRPST